MCVEKEIPGRLAGVPMPVEDHDHLTRNEGV